jgi:hypothetical protein
MPSYDVAWRALFTRPSLEEEEDVAGLHALLTDVTKRVSDIAKRAGSRQPGGKGAGVVSAAAASAAVGPSTRPLLSSACAEFLHNFPGTSNGGQRVCDE